MPLPAQHAASAAAPLRAATSLSRLSSSRCAISPEPACTTPPFLDILGILPTTAARLPPLQWGKAYPRLSSRTPSATDEDSDDGGGGGRLSGGTLSHPSQSQSQSSWDVVGRSWPSTPTPCRRRRLSLEPNYGSKSAALQPLQLLGRNHFRLQPKRSWRACGQLCIQQIDRQTERQTARQPARR